MERVCISREQQELLTEVIITALDDVNDRHKIALNCIHLEEEEENSAHI